MPIIGVLPNDETKKILLRVGVSTVADVDSPLEIVGVLHRVLDAWRRGELSALLPNPSECEASQQSGKPEVLCARLKVDRL